MKILETLEEIYHDDYSKKKQISCGTCSNNCAGSPGNPSQYGNECLREGNKISYHGWLLYSDNYKYSLWEPRHPEIPYELPEELFKIDV